MYQIIKRALKSTHIRNPRLAFRAGVSLLRARIFKRPVLKYLDVAIDYRCNMRCQHCFAIYSLKDDRRKQLSIADWHRVAQQAIGLGCLHINIQGGEPFIFDNLPEYISAFCPDKCHISITTNGSCLTREKLAAVKAAGARQLIFSLDSQDAEVHDQFRHFSGAHDKVLVSIELAREMGLAVAVNVTVSHESLAHGSQEGLFAWLKRENIPFNPILACAVGGWADEKGLLVTEEDVEHVEALCESRLGQRDLHASWVKTGCGATAEQLYLTAYGDAIPCPFIQVSLGNLQQEALGVDLEASHGAGALWTLRAELLGCSTCRIRQVSDRSVRQIREAADSAYGCRRG